MEAAGKTEDKAEQAAKAPAGAAAVADEDLSMEEILQSIRRIIAEDDKDGKDGKKPAADKANGAKAKGKDDEVPGSDVFELTDMVKDDGSVVNVKAEPAKAAPSTDVLDQIDAALSTDKKAAEVPAAKPAASPQADIDAMFASPPPPAAPVAAVADSSDSLLSSTAAAAATQSLNKLKAADQYVPPAPTTPAPAFRDGTTVEDLVTEMLKPMMKGWLDNNLPQLVERIVEREIRKLTK